MKFFDSNDIIIGALSNRSSTHAIIITEEARKMIVESESRQGLSREQKLRNDKIFDEIFGQDKLERIFSDSKQNSKKEKIDGNDKSSGKIYDFEFGEVSLNELKEVSRETMYYLAPIIEGSYETIKEKKTSFLNKKNFNSRQKKMN